MSADRLDGRCDLLFALLSGALIGLRVVSNRLVNALYVACRIAPKNVGRVYFFSVQITRLACCLGGPRHP